MDVLIEITDEDLSNRFGSYRENRMFQVIYADFIVNMKEVNYDGMGWRIGLRDGSTLLGFMMEGGFCPVERYYFKIGAGFAYSR